MKGSSDRLHRKNKPKIFITGINGFVGSHLSDLLIPQGYSLSGLAYGKDIRHLAHFGSDLDLHYGDIRDMTLLRQIISKVQPDYIYHLAGQPFVPDADKNILNTYEINVLGVLNLLEAVRIAKLNPRILIISSGEVYGAVPEDQLPVNEDYPLKPVNPYAVTKACADLLTCQYAIAHQLYIIRVRPFNHIGPRQSEQFVCSNFAKQIVEIELGLREPVLKVGKLDVKRDFTDVRDVVRAYQIVLERAKGGEVYNIGRNKAFFIREVIDMLIKQSTRSDIQLQQRSERLRPNDIPIMMCDTTKIEKEFGWKPEIFIQQTLCDLLEYWRKEVSLVKPTI